MDDLWVGGVRGGPDALGDARVKGAPTPPLTRIIHENILVNQKLASGSIRVRTAHPARSGKNIGGNGLHSKWLTLRGNPGQIFLEISGFARRVDVEPILYCPANPLIGQDFARTDPYLVNYPG
jgi:hypothetical protein